MSGIGGWRSWQRQSSSGAIDSEQSVVAPYPVVSESEQGAAQLGARYWLEVERFARGLVHARVRGGRLELRLLGEDGQACRCGVIVGEEREIGRHVDEVSAADQKLPRGPVSGTSPSKRASW